MNHSSERYVKELNINPEMSHNKLLNRIKRGSKILEFGPASGVMTKVLSKEMDCQVTIVEIDKKCYENVMEKYAQNGICSDIEDFEWEEAFINEKFDYIMFADVLEHLRTPEKVLLKVKRFLKQDGSILISVPNIAHNSVIIQLLNNRFIYQSTGILDYTHIRHFTFEELHIMCIDSGYGIVYQDAVYIGVGRNEFDISYADVDKEISEILKKRPFGEVYQHIVELKNQEYIEKNNIKIENHLGNWVTVHAENERIKNINKADKPQPNVLFENNAEIARLRLEINEIYHANDDLRNAVDYREKIYSYQDEIRVKNHHIKSLNDIISKYEKRIIELQKAEEERNNHINKLDIEIRDNRIMIKKLQEDNDKSTILGQEGRELIESYGDIVTEFQKLNNDYRNKVSQMEEFNKNNFLQLNELKEINNNKEKELSELRQIIRNKEGHIQLLLEVEREYERDKMKYTYKLFKKTQRVIDFILPPKSSRRFVCQVLMKFITNPKLMFKAVNGKRIKNFFIYLRLEGIDGVKRRFEESLKTTRNNQKNGAGKLVEIIENNEGEADSIAAYEKLILPLYDKPEVSIIIPVYNQFNYTYNCIKSIINNSKNVTYEIIIANDCSTDITKEIEKVIENARVITTKENVRFLLNCNNAAKHAKGKYILFLNNDTQVQENWLKPLVDLIESDEKIGMVGSKLIYPDGTLQEAGGIVWKDASAWNYGNRRNPEDPEFNYVKEADYISGAAIMIRKSLWEEMGGFDERFVPAYYEDTDLAFEVRKKGYKVMYQPLSRVVHFEGISNGTNTQTGLKHYQEVNFSKFYEKWKETLEKEHEENARNVFTAKDRSNRKKHILVVDHYVPHHDKDAGGKCTFMYLKTFVKMGFKVTFIGDNFFKHEPYTTELNQMGIEVLYGNFYYKNWQKWLKDNCRYFDYVYLQRPHISVKYIDLVKNYSRAKILYFAHDLHHIREYREYEMTKDPKKLQSSKEWKKIEYGLFEKADVGHVVGSFEQELMQKEFPNKPIRNIPLYIYESILEDINKDFSTRSNIMYVGGFGHPPNIDAVLWFAKEVFPLVLKKYPKMKWHVVGGKAPQEILDLASENIIIEGFLPDEELEKLYRECRIAIVPLRFGAGVKGKVVESAYYQIPLITTSIGAEGLSRKEEFMIVEDEADRLANAICNLYEDYPAMKKMSDNGIDFIKNYFTLEKAEKVLRYDIS